MRCKVGVSGEAWVAANGVTQCSKQEKAKDGGYGGLIGFCHGFDSAKCMCLPLSGWGCHLLQQLQASAMQLYLPLVCGAAALSAEHGDIGLRSCLRRGSEGESSEERKEGSAEFHGVGSGDSGVFPLRCTNHNPGSTPR